MRFHPSFLVVSLLQATLALAVGLTGSPAAACSPAVPHPLYFTFADSLPGEDERLLVNGAVLLIPRGWEVYAESQETFDEVLTVTVTDLETGATIPGRLQTWRGGAAWRPEASLLPNRRYELLGTLQQQAPRPADAQGSTELRKTFTTSDQEAAPLEFLGDVEIRFEEFERDKLECHGASCECEKVGKETSTRAHIEIPSIQGGALPGAYQVEFWVTDNTPYRFGEPDQHLEHEVLWGVWTVDSSGAPTETAFEMPRNSSPYRPCFTYRVVDPAGNTHEGPPVCMDKEIEPPGDAGGFLGCAAGPGRPQGVAFLVLLGAVALVWRSRRGQTA